MLDLGVIGSGKLRQLKRSEYDRLVSLGAFDDERVELLRGLLVEMSPIDPLHADTIDSAEELLNEGIARRARVRVQQPFIAFDESEPQPDIAVVPLGNYYDEHPAEALLVIEVAGSSLRLDRLVKGPLYAASKVAECWIVNLRDRVVEVYRGRGDAWSDVTYHDRDAVLRPLHFPDVKLRVSDFLR